MSGECQERLDKEAIEGVCCPRRTRRLVPLSLPYGMPTYKPKNQLKTLVSVDGFVWDGEPAF